MKLDTCEVIISIGSQLAERDGVMGRPEGSVLPYSNGTGNIIFQVLVHEPGQPDVPRSEAEFKARMRERLELAVNQAWSEIQRKNQPQGQEAT